MATQRVTFENYTPFYTERTERLHAMLINCGHEMARADYRHDGLKRGSRDLLIWQYTLSGMGRAAYLGREYPVPPGHALFLMVPEEHVYYLPPGSPSWDFIYVSVTGSELVRLGAEYRKRNGIVRPFGEHSPAVKAAWELLALCREKRLTGRYDASARAYSFLMTLLAEPAVNAPEEGMDFMSRVHAYCREHLREPFTVADLADAAGCSRWHFSRKFQELEGQSPHAFIIEQKMRLAQRLLQTTTGSVKEIAGACGFEDTSYFCKVFKSVHGVTPGNFREPGSIR